MKQILVPLNLRSDYESILDYACSLAERSRAQLTFFYAASRKTLNRTNVLLLNQDDTWEKAEKNIAKTDIRRAVAKILHLLEEKQIHYRFKFISGSASYSIMREANTGLYDLLLMGSHAVNGWRSYFRSTMASRLIGQLTTPLFVVPARHPFNGLENISYAVDLEDYDPEIIRQVKSIATLFDARLSIVHVNEAKAEAQTAQYRDSLEQVISATLDYPKICYKFFDHADPFGGIVKFVSQSNSNLLAMTSRKKISWSNWFSNRSLTRKIANEVQVPILAFRK